MTATWKPLFALLICLALFTTPNFAQTPTLLISGDNKFEHVEDFVPDPNVEGAFRMLARDTPMALYLEGNPEPYNVPAANINLLDHSVLLTYSSSTVYIMATYVDSVLWDDHLLIHRKHLDKDAGTNSLLQLTLQARSTRLLKDQKMELLPPTYNESLQLGNKNYTLDRSVHYYLQDSDDRLLELNKKFKDFKEKKYASALKKFAKSERIDFKREADLQKLVQYIDQREQL